MFKTLPHLARLVQNWRSPPCSQHISLTVLLANAPLSISLHLSAPFHVLLPPSRPSIPADCQLFVCDCFEAAVRLFAPTETLRRSGGSRHSSPPASPPPHSHPSRLWQPGERTMTAFTCIRITVLVGLKSNDPFHVNTFVRLCAVRLRSD